MKLRTKLRVTRRLKPNPAHRNFFRRPAVCGYRAHVHDHVQVVAHNRTGMHAAGKNVSQLQNADFNQRFTVLESFAEVFVQAAKPRPARTPIHAVKRSGLGGIDELAARPDHGRSLGFQALRANQIGRNLGSDLSKG